MPTAPPAGLPAHVAETVAELTGSHAAAVTWCRPGFSGQLAAAAGLARETANLLAAAGTVPAAAVIGHCPRRAVLLTDALDGTAPDWDDPTTFHHALAALATLDRLPTLPASCHRLADWFRPRPETTHRHSAALLGKDIAANAADCWDQLHLLAADRPAHCDPHPRNWVLHRNRPHLVDFDHLGYAPAGFDAAYLAAFLDIDTGLRADALLEICTPGAAETLTGAITYRFARGVHANVPGWSTWCARTLESAAALYRQICDRNR